MVLINLPQGLYADMVSRARKRARVNTSAS
jgi:hypothetical protein